MPGHNDSKNVSEQRSCQPTILSPAVAKGREQPLLTEGLAGLFMTPTQHHTLCHEGSQDGGSSSDIFPENSPRHQYSEPQDMISLHEYKQI